MSIYSGFSTRQTEQSYNNLLFKAVQIVQDKLIQFITLDNKNVELNGFTIKFMRIIKRMKQYEQRKYLPPKFTSAFQSLISKIENSNIQYDNQHNSISITQKSQKNQQLSKQLIVQKRELRGQSQSSKKELKLREIGPVELPPKYRVVYNSHMNNQNNQKGISNRLNTSDQENKHQRNKKKSVGATINILNQYEPKVNRNNSISTKNGPILRHHEQKSFLTIQENPLTYYSGAQHKQQLEIGHKVLPRYRQLRSKEGKKPFLQTIKQRIRTQEGNKFYNE